MIAAISWPFCCVVMICYPVADCTMCAVHVVNVRLFTGFVNNLVVCLVIVRCVLLVLRPWLASMVSGPASQRHGGVRLPQ
jgi:hypothetical protein